VFCSKCGAANPEGPDVRYCRSCGAELTKPAYASTPEGYSTPPPPTGGYAAAPSLAVPVAVAPSFSNPPVPIQAAVFPYGGFWIRLVAYLIDSFLLTGAWVAALASAGTANLGEPADWGLLFWGLYLLWLFLTLAYYIVLPPTLGATLGKLAVGYHIVGRDARHVGYGRAAGRCFAQIVSAIVLCLGYVWIGFDLYKQGWHDKIAGTFVIRKEFVKR